jgi:hypothetical protein
MSARRATQAGGISDATLGASADAFLGRVYKIHSANLAVLFALAFVAPRAVISSIATLVAPCPAPKIPRDLERKPFYKHALEAVPQQRH